RARRRDQRSRCIGRRGHRGSRYLARGAADRRLLRRAGGLPPARRAAAPRLASLESARVLVEDIRRRIVADLEVDLLRTGIGLPVEVGVEHAVAEAVRARLAGLGADGRAELVDLHEALHEL